MRAAALPAAITKLTEAGIERTTEHSLRSSRRSSPNPRSMKRFVIAYAMARTVSLVEDNLVSSDQLALWTVLRTRWPYLADHLALNPNDTDILFSGTAPDGIPSGLAPLFGSAELRRVVTFPSGGPLTAAAVRRLVGGADAVSPKLGERPD